MQQLAEWLGGYIWLTAFVLGALHALQPGHGKTIVAAYLVGTRGTVKDAIFLGVVVTFTHTLIIYVLALLAQGGAMFMPVQELEQYLGAFASLLILLVGILLLRAQWRRRPGHGGDPAKGGHHRNGHDHGHHQPQAAAHAHDHSHWPGVPHHHAKPGETNSLSKVFLLGVSGGVVPCPEGLAVFLAALAGGQVRTGVLLVIVFSLGLATTLVAVGILFLKASSLLGAGSGAGRWGYRIGWASAVLITVVGAVYMSKYVYLLA